MDHGLLKVKNISKYFCSTGIEKILVLENVEFSIIRSDKGKIVSVIGPFGCGKTTLFKIIAGLLKPDSGEVLINGNPYKNPTGEVAYLPEKPSHFPWLNVKENINFISRIRGKNGPESIDKIISLTGLSGYEDHIPHNRSFGFRFRASLGRALAADPKIILLDDVFKNLDTQTKSELFITLKQIKNELSCTIVIGTANLSDTIILSDQIFLMNGKPGKIIGEIKPERLNESHKELKTEEFTSIRNEIEFAYQAGQHGSSINISI